MSTIKTIEGTFVNASARYIIAVARWNGFVVESLLEGALDTLRRHGVADKDILIVRVPGAFELPLATTVTRLLHSARLFAVVRRISNTSRANVLKA